MDFVPLPSYNTGKGVFNNLSFNNEEISFNIDNKSEERDTENIPLERNDVIEEKNEDEDEVDKISKTDKTIDELKEEIIKDETKDIIINVKKIEKESLDKMFNVDMISYDYIDNILYQDLLNALNIYFKHYLFIKHARRYIFSFFKCSR